MNDTKPDPASAIDADAALNVLRGDLGNILKKIPAGKPLTEGERKLFNDLLASRTAEEAERANTLAVVATNNYRKRLSKTERTHETRMRRLRVFELRCAGLSITKIAERLHSTRETIIKDCRVLEAEFTQTLNVAEATRLVRERLMELSIGKMIAMRAVAKDDGGQRAGFLSVWLNIISKEVELMQAVGLIPKTAIALQHSGPDSGPIQVQPVEPKKLTLDDLSLDELRMLDILADRSASKRN